jgi:NAD(P)-dependent dehydrogenase (short-subunit alcohol dehydrogenase family)
VKPFKGKRILVTGAGKGIGRETVLLLAQQGADVVAISRTASDLHALQETVGCQTRQAAETAGVVDGLVNNAGISILQPFLETTLEAFDQIMAVNVRAALIVSQVVAHKMIENHLPGAIVNVSSQSSMRAVKDHTAYCTSKGALDQLTRMMALELGPHNIRVNSVHPTVTLTPMGEMAWSDPAKSGPVLARIPLGHFAQPVDVAQAIAYLLGDQARMIHGALLPLDGGFLVS